MTHLSGTSAYRASAITKAMKAVTLVVSTGVIAIGSTYCFADAQVVSGNACLPQDDLEMSAFVFSNTRLTNISDSAKTVICPIARLDLASTRGAVASVQIVRSNVTTTRFGCWFENVSNRGLLMHYRYAYFSGSGLASLDTSIPTSSPDSHYNFRCSVPAQSSILSYRIDER